ncbi:type II toxin-antitoxin system RelE/ParE family toxin [Methylobacterium currus]|uniref:Type II toxin-antitoxin system RelE/ParE family toxin n=1 Tax=Methylobacterium currus TaxID=2051553 RepID=A0A2R4WN93_9HYPH|nr:type II toxin-antitoxin system RelE/ParE family toxin [Methylobacterium currus]AWB23006.1 type II toxin-antitoxin system RelE/ParE family toxin [Methylobacterium currus]UHC17386.1 type II toxin-antitoxin system RelE/ParE family toxin [Methylobacterium currus]
MIDRTTRQADEDFYDLFADGVLNVSQARAEAHEAELFRTFARLAADPRTARERRDLPPPARLHPDGAHPIISAVERDHILIVRNLHGRQDWDSLPS